MSEFFAEKPVRVYIGFAAKGSGGKVWLEPQESWDLLQKASYEVNKPQCGIKDIYYRDVPAGKVKLFRGSQGAYCLLGIEPVVNLDFGFYFTHKPEMA